MSVLLCPFTQNKFKARGHDAIRFVNNSNFGFLSAKRSGEC
jgi:hypothetical protein